MEPNVFSEIYLPPPPSSSIYLLLLRKTTTCEKKTLMIIPTRTKIIKIEDPKKNPKFFCGCLQ